MTLLGGLLIARSCIWLASLAGLPFLGWEILGWLLAGLGTVQVAVVWPVAKAPPRSRHELIVLSRIVRGLTVVGFAYPGLRMMSSWGFSALNEIFGLALLAQLTLLMVFLAILLQDGSPRLPTRFLSRMAWVLVGVGVFRFVTSVQEWIGIASITRFPYGPQVLSGVVIAHHLAAGVLLIATGALLRAYGRQYWVERT
jgi:hypothetical protein